MIASCIGPEDTDKFLQRIERGLTPEAAVCTLRGVDFRQILEQGFRCHPVSSHRLFAPAQTGVSYLKSRPKHPKSDNTAQESFRQELPAKLKAIAETGPLKRLRRYFEDESCFGQQLHFPKLET